MISTYSLLLLLAAMPVAPQTATRAKPVPAADPQKKVCRRVETTGSIMPGKSVCRTRVEWAAIDDANAKAVSEASELRGSGMSQN